MLNESNSALSIQNSTFNGFPGGHRRGVTPVPIPNTEVKLSTADGTACVSVWESRSLPGLLLQKARCSIEHRAFSLLRANGQGKREKGELPFPFSLCPFPFLGG